MVDDAKTSEKRGQLDHKMYEEESKVKQYKDLNEHESLQRPNQSNPTTNKNDTENQKIPSTKSKMPLAVTQISGTEDIARVESGINRMINTFETFANDCEIGELYRDGLFVGSIFDEKGGYLRVSCPGDTVLFIPPGAIKEGQRQEVYCYVEDYKYQKLKSGQVVLTPIVHCGPDGTNFEQDIVLKIPHCAAKVDSWHFAPVVKQSSDTWSTLSAENMLVTAKSVFLFLRHFTGFGAVAEIKEGQVGEQRVNIGVTGHFEDSKHCLVKVGVWYGNQSHNHQITAHPKWKVIKPIVIDEKDTLLKIGFLKIQEGWKIWDGISNTATACESLSTAERFRHWYEAWKPTTNLIEKATWHKLCEILDVERPNFSDWRGFADALGLHPLQIETVSKKDSPTGLLLSFIFADLISTYSVIDILKKLEDIFIKIENAVARDVIQEEIKRATSKDGDEVSDSGISNNPNEKQDDLPKVSSSYTSDTSTNDDTDEVYIQPPVRLTESVKNQNLLTIHFQLLKFKNKGRKYHQHQNLSQDGKNRLHKSYL
ncbi:uncharacterized protein [Ptychodera flava]|uniref:uncharacterized protein n=1 Tax=Ptychodera flava TaxID=63121 RepID=UPI00396A519D